MSKTGKLAMLVFKQRLSQDSPEFLTSNISPCPPHYINTKIGTSPSKRNRTICPTVKIQRKTHIKSRWYFITMFQVSWSFSFLFPLPSKRGAVLPQHFPSFTRKQDLATNLCISVPYFQAFLQQLHVQWHFPFSAKS